MWENAIAKDNREKLSRFDYRFIEPDEGWLACRNVGPGRLAEPARIVDEICTFLKGDHANENPHHRRPHARAD
jgi:phosphopantothenoylcysteine synthetase/decarboxylase